MPDLPIRSNQFLSTVVGSPITLFATKKGLKSDLKSVRDTITENSAYSFHLEKIQTDGKKKVYLNRNSSIFSNQKK
ncbi:hypothetical protein A0128_08355 [Leptospira tipperaryensis]|uniref:Uncharacterized protein n=1 Tax=Leptospira tipperaryensis TaxID=2564040 RepID=A0A1D7UWC0_9LEPT|nr:hypothetical protein A0128_08355 [Leptospira tipperaryensis]